MNSAESLYLSFLKQFQNNIPPLVFIYGAEDYLIQNLQKKILELVVEEESRAFNLKIFWGKDCTADEVIATCHQFPVNSAKRLVILQKVDEMRNKEGLQTYFKDPMPSTCLTITAGRISKPAKESKKGFYGILISKALVAECRTPNENKLKTWIYEYLRQKGSNQEKDSLAEILLDKIGKDMTILAQEMDKISLLASPNGHIDLAWIENSLQDRCSFYVYNLIEALTQKDAVLLLKSLHHLIMTGEDPTYLAAVIAQQFRQIWQAKTASPDIASGATTKNPKQNISYAELRALKAAQLFTEQDLLEAFNMLFRLDIKFKTESLNLQQRYYLLEQNLLQYCL